MKVVINVFWLQCSHGIVTHYKQKSYYFYLWKKIHISDQLDCDNYETSKLKYPDNIS